MSFLPVGFAECTAVFQIPGDAGPANVVTGHDVSGLATGVAVLDAIQAGWEAATPITANSSDDSVLISYEVRWQAAAGDPTILTRTTNLPGGSASTPMPPQVATLLQKQTGFAGRKNRGRMYLPGVVEGVVDGAGFFTGAHLVAVAAAAAGGLSNWNTNGAPLHILHTDPADTPREVIELSVSPKVATQRRRLR